MSSLWITIPATLLLAGSLVALVVRAARRGDYDDWEGPAVRMICDDDSAPEIEQHRELPVESDGAPGS